MCFVDSTEPCASPSSAPGTKSVLAPAALDRPRSTCGNNSGSTKMRVGLRLPSTASCDAVVVLVLVSDLVPSLVVALPWFSSSSSRRETNVRLFDRARRFARSFLVLLRKVVRGPGGCRGWFVVVFRCGVVVDQCVPLPQWWPSASRSRVTASNSCSREPRWSFSVRLYSGEGGVH